MVKMRVGEMRVIELLCRVINDHLYVVASDVSKVFAGLDLDGLKDELVFQLGSCLKRNSDVLIKGNFSAGVIGCVERKCRFSILSDEQIGKLSPVERGCYLDNASPARGSDAEKACVDELLRQFDANNSPGHHIGFATRPSSLLCRSLDGGGSETFEESLLKVLEHCLQILPEYHGSPCSAGEAVTVLNKFICCRLRDGKPIPDGWADLVSVLPEEWPEDPVFRDPVSMDSCAWTVRCKALRVVVGLSNDIDFLALGIRFATLSASGQRAYLETLDQLIDCAKISDTFANVVSAICSTVFLSEDSGVRTSLMTVIAASYRRWKLSSLSDLVCRAVRDVSSDVVYRLLQLCKEAKFVDGELERSLIEQISANPNWFIRWHAVND